MREFHSLQIPPFGGAEGHLEDLTDLVESLDPCPPNSVGSVSPDDGLTCGVPPDGPDPSYSTSPGVIWGTSD